MHYNVFVMKHGCVGCIGSFAQRWYLKNPFDRTVSMGTNGAIGGIYGLMYVQLMKMETSRGIFRVIKGMGLVFLIGTLIDNVPRQLNYSNEFAPAESVPWILY